MNKKEKSFWVTNISKMNVSLADLNLTIKAFTTINLLDNKHYSLTEEQLLKSVENGSIFKKRDKIIVRKQNPEINQPHNILIERDNYLPSRERSIMSIKQNNYEELNVSDESFASEMADLNSNED